MEEKKYLQIYMKMRQDIVNGVYPFGTKLPSKRVTAENFDTSVITVQHAYELLADEGYILPKERSGYFVSYSESDTFPVSVSHFTPLPPAGTQPDTNLPFSVYAKAVRRALSLYDVRLFEKSPGAGWMPLRRAISGYLARSRGISVTAEQIVIGSGAEHLYGLIVQLLGTDCAYAMESPSYEKIEQVYRANGARCELLALGNDGIRSGELKKTMAKVLHITPYRSFPSGVTASAAKKQEYLRWAQKMDAVIIEDDFESEFSLSRKPEDTVFSLDDSGRVIYINTFSKTIAPAIRIGYMVLPKKLLPLLEEKAGFYSCTVPTPEQQFLTEIIESGDFERHLNRVRRINRRKI